MPTDFDTGGGGYRGREKRSLSDIWDALELIASEHSDMHMRMLIEEGRELSGKKTGSSGPGGIGTPFN
jgi:hypothetical protein